MSAKTTHVYLESRYRKLVRDLPQTIFWCPECKGHRRRRVGCVRCCGRGKIADDSVQELIARRVLPAFRAKAGKFHGAGREDVDVRMLGRGRPFVFEVVGPRCTDVDFDDLLRRINDQETGRIEVDPFRRVARRRVAELKEGHFYKRYRIGVRVDGTLDRDRARSLEGEEIEVAQRTPQRVVHRRADLVRQRRVTVLAVGFPEEDDVGLEVDVETSHGTYVKEWVSGDGGRSTPSLPELVEVDAASCARLDVLEVLDDASVSA